MTPKYLRNLRDHWWGWPRKETRKQGGSSDIIEGESQGKQGGSSDMTPRYLRNLRDHWGGGLGGAGRKQRYC